MASRFADKIIKAAKAEAALHLTATETRQLATELGQMSRMIMTIIHSEIEAGINPDKVAEMFSECLLSGLTGGGLQLSTDGERWWLNTQKSHKIICAATLYEGLCELRSELKLNPPSPAILKLKGDILYQNLEELLR